jgi:hypothetical protein
LEFEQAVSQPSDGNVLSLGGALGLSRMKR